VRYKFLCYIDCKAYFKLIPLLCWLWTASFLLVFAPVPYPQHRKAVIGIAQVLSWIAALFSLSFYLFFLFFLFFFIFYLFIFFLPAFLS